MMAFKVDKNKGGSRYTRRSFTLNTSNDNPSRGIGAPNIEFYELEPAEVVDIILDDQHTDFKNYGDIGKAKVRLVKSEVNKDEGLLTYAKPLDTGIKNFPLLHEVVIVVRYIDELFYTQRLNLFNNVNESSFPFVSTSAFKGEGTTKANAQEYEDVSTSGNTNTTGKNSDIALGQVFKRNGLIRPLQAFEGDYIIEGRFGESIRLGSNQETGFPTFKLRVGQPEDVPDNVIQPIEEDLNLDQNSIWIGTDEDMPLNPATIESDVHLQFYPDKPSEFIGNQIFMNSDRIVFNTKQNEFMVYAKRAINLVTQGMMTVDAETDIILNSPKTTIINSPEIYLGSADATEPVVLGDSWETVMGELIDAILALIVPTPAGPSGTPINAADFTTIKQKLNSVLSKQNFSL